MPKPSHRKSGERWSFVECRPYRDSQETRRTEGAREKRLGGYYQWDNHWKISGRFGVQSFGGAQVLTRTPFQPFTQPVVRLDLDRMDDNDNRLFGVTAQIASVPKAILPTNPANAALRGQELVHLEKI